MLCAEEQRLRGLQQWLEHLSSSGQSSSAELRLTVGALIVEEMRAAVEEHTGFSCSAGVSHNKVCCIIHLHGYSWCSRFIQMIWSALNSRTQTYEALIRFRSDPISVPGYIYIWYKISLFRKKVISYTWISVLWYINIILKVQMFSNTLFEGVLVTHVLTIIITINHL